MPKFDPTITLGVLLSVCALFSSVLTTFLNNKHQEKLKHIEFRMNQYYNTSLYNRRIYEKYLRYAGLCVLSWDPPTEKYNEYYYLALMCSPKYLRDYFILIHEYISEENWTRAKEVLDKLVPYITELTQ